MDNLPLVQFVPFGDMEWRHPRHSGIFRKIRSYEKNDRYQHAPYPWLLSRVATIDLDLDGSSLKGLVPGPPEGRCVC